MVTTTSRASTRRAAGTGPDDAGDDPSALPQRIVVPVDGSPFAERALPIATWAAGTLGVPVHLVEVVGTGAGADDATVHLDDLARRHGAAGWNVARSDDPGRAIVTAARVGGTGLVCLATHGRDRSAAALGSVAMTVLDVSTDPVLLVGPAARPPCADDSPVVVAVDGTADDDALTRSAATWSAGLRRPLVVATVAEPVPGSFRPDRPTRRARGPADPEAYVARMAAAAAAAAGPGTRVDARVAYDPVSVRDGVVDLVDRTAALLVVGTHRRTRPRRAVVGSHAARIVHDLEVPALVVPLDAGG